MRSRKTVKVKAAELRRFLSLLCAKAGISKADSACLVEGLLETSLRGVDSHGVRLMPHYVRAVESCVNTVLPGWVPTERQLTKWWSPEGEAGTMRDQALKRRIMPDELASLQECFICGTGAEVTPVSQIGPYNFTPGAISRQLMEDYTALVNGAA